MPLTADQEAEIDAQRAAPRQTLRAVSDGMEARLYRAHPVLDHGFVRVIDYMGDDAAICQAARVSYGRGTKSVQNDEGLIRYLMRHWHSTPFEMCEVEAPRQAAGLRRAAVDPAPHRERERIFRPLFDPRPGVLHPPARGSGRAVGGEQPGPGRGACRARRRRGCWTG